MRRIFIIKELQKDYKIKHEIVNHQEGSNEGSNVKLTKKGCKNKPEISIKNCLMKKRIKKDSMVEVDIAICQWKTNKAIVVFKKMAS